jgi:excisionase family DNA binding protein
VAALLRLPVEAVSARAQAGELPGRRFGDEWRFARTAVMDWLARGEKSSGADPGPTAGDPGSADAGDE